MAANRRLPVNIPSQGNQPAPFRGIDRRGVASLSDPSSLWDAYNCDLTVNGGIRRRDGLVAHAELPPHTIGLFAAGGKLHVAVPAGYGYQTALPADIRGDVFGDSETAATSLTRYVRMTSVLSWGAREGSGAIPYFILKTDAGQHIHHWIDEVPALPTDPVLTSVSQQFLSGPAALKIAQKVYAIDAVNGTVPYSSTEFGPSVWSEAEAPDDAGFLQALEHAQSDVNVKGLTLHQGKLVIVYAQAMQFWTVSSDPSKNVWNFTLTGPGTNLFNSLAPVIGDVFYFSEGGFHSLATQTQTGELRDGDIGASIQKLTAQFIAANEDDVVATWSQARSQYLCFVNDGDTCQVFAYTLSPAFGVTGWTRWVLPLNIDYVAELNGIMYLRSGDMIYKLDPLAITDEIDGVETTIDAYFETQFVDGGYDMFMKQWLTMDVISDSIIDIDVLTDRNDRSIRLPVAQDVEGSTYDGGNIPVDVSQNAVAVRVRFNAPGTVESLSFDAVLTAGSR
jgi:hypothetical protein